MNHEHDEIPEDPADAVDPLDTASLDQALDGAFDLGDGQTLGPSVLEHVSQVSGKRPGVTLRDAESQGNSPILRPPGTAEPKASGKYIVHGEMSRGGMGSIHRGHDQELGRDVALKFLHEKFRHNPEVLHRFVEEAQIGGQLQHPGIVPVYDMGMAGDRPFFAMKLVKGDTLQRLLRDRRATKDDLRRFLGIFEHVCQTVAYAHARGVVHRDIKPANIMVGAFGEVLVADWGMGKVLASGGVADERSARNEVHPRSVIATLRSSGDGSQSQLGSVLGTPAYMPPEQALGQIDLVDERSDVFSLGATLCEILTGEPPYAGPSEELLLQACQADTADARRRLDSCGAPRELVALCQRCLEGNRRLRPHHAGELAEAITGYLAAVEERAQRAMVEAAEAKVRARATTVLAAAAVLLVCLGGATWFFVESAAATRRSKAEGLVADAYETASSRLGSAAGGQDEVLWTSAREAVAKVEDLARVPDVGAALRDRVARLAADAREKYAEARRRGEAARRDQEMREAMLAALVPDERDPGALVWYRGAAAKAARDYAEALDRYLADKRGATSFVDASSDQMIAWIEGSALREELAICLDSWVMERRNAAQEGDLSARLQAAARALDSADTWRQGLRDVLLDPESGKETLLRLRKEARLDTQPAVAVRILAQALWRAGEKAVAVEVFDEACARQPGSIAAQLSLGFYRQSLGDLETALAQYRTCIAMRPDLPELRKLHGRCLMDLGRYADAIEVFSRLHEAEPANAIWLNELAVAHSYRQEMERARELAEKAVASDPGHFESRYTLARVSLVLGDTDAAERQLREALRLEESNHLVMQVLATIRIAGKAYQEALQVCEAGLREDPDSTILLVKKAQALRGLGRVAESRACLAKAREFGLEKIRTVMAVHRHTVELWYLALACMELGMMQEAVQHLEELVRFPHAGWLQLRQLSRCYSQLGQFDKALPVCRRAVREHPDKLEAKIRLVVVLMELPGGMQEAERTLEEVLAADPDAARAHSMLGISRLRQGQRSAGLDALRKALQLAPDDENVVWDVALAYFMASDWSAAKRYLSRLSEMKVPSAAQLGMLARCQAATGEPRAAIDNARRALAMSPHHPQRTEWWNFLGLAQNALGQHEAALQTFTKGVADCPEDPALHGNLCSALTRAGRHEEAIAAGKKAVRLNPKMVPAWSALADAHRAVDDPEGEAAAYAGMIANDAQAYTGHFNLIKCLMRMGKEQEAADRAAAAMELFPRQPDILAVTCEAMTAARRTEAAIDAAQRAVRLVGFHSYPHYLLGFAYLQAGEKEKAEAALEAARKITGRGALSGELRERVEAALKDLR